MGCFYRVNSKIRSKRKNYSYFCLSDRLFYDIISAGARLSLDVERGSLPLVAETPFHIGALSRREAGRGCSCLQAACLQAGCNAGTRLSLDVERGSLPLVTETPFRMGALSRWEAGRGCSCLQAGCNAGTRLSLDVERGSLPLVAETPFRMGALSRREAGQGCSCLQAGCNMGIIAQSCTKLGGGTTRSRFTCRLSLLPTAGTGVD